MASKKCRKCGAIFDGKGYTLFCPECRKPTDDGKRVCPYCGKEFTPRSPKQITCWSRACVRANRDKFSAMALEEKRAVKIQNIRHCHDCGLPTTNYRCAKCWAKIRGGHYDDGVDS